MNNTPPIVKIQARAKINLTLHITGKRKDGYHLLDSIIAFADKGDEIAIAPADKFTLKTNGEFADQLPLNKNDNLICQAAKKLAQELNQDLKLSITLTKSIPIGAGLGGGSSDAAATIKGLLNFWKAKIGEKELNDILLSLGADVPACFHAKPCHVSGIGEKITEIPRIPALPALLLYPDIFCSSASIFKNHDENYSIASKIPQKFSDHTALYKFLHAHTNELTGTAIKQFPIIQSTLDTIEGQNGCALARMSGSGSACFGLFDTKQNSLKAAIRINKANPSWWVQPVTIGG